MATLYPAQEEPQHIEAPAGGFTTLTISNLIAGDPFYTHIRSVGIVAICMGAYSHHLPQNRLEDTFLMVAYGDVLVIPLEELAQEAYSDQERWNGAIPGVSS